MTKKYDFCLFNIKEEWGRVIWEITNTCNYKCSYCIFSSDIHGKGKELSFEEIKSTMDTLKKSNFTSIKFTWGEPFLRKDMIEIVKYADELGFSFDISTNASLVTESIVKELSQLKNLSYVHVSLDGATQKLQEQIRGIGTFKPTIKGIQLLKKYGIYVRIWSILYKHNEDNIEAIIQYVLTLRVDEIIFSFMEAVGRMSGNTTLLSTKSSTQLIAELEQLKKRYEKQILISYAFSKQASSNTTTTCPGGEKFFSIDSLGNGSPCTWISEHFPEFISNENIKNTSSTPTIHQQSIKKFRTFLNKMATLGFLGCPKEFLPEAKEVLWIDNYLHKISHTPLSAGRRFWEDGALYAFTTENLKEYYDFFDFTDKHCLLIGGSGDQMINAFMKGAKQVEIFDTNKLARYYIELKWTALKNLSYSEFKEFFFINKNAFTYQRYEKFREQLSFWTRYFFDELYKLFDYQGEKIRTSNIFNTSYDTKENKIRYNSYVESEENYNTCLAGLKEKSYTFLNLDFRELHTLAEINTCDLIMLGNISDYLEEIYKTTDYISCFAKDIEKLYKKSPYCSIIFAYLYDIENKKQRSNIDTPHYQKDLINFLNAESAIFTSAISLQKKDKILYIKGEQSLMEDSKSYNAGSEIYENFSQAEDFPGKVLQELIPITTGKTILDIWCGTWKFLWAIWEKASKVYGLDKSQQQLNIASSKLENPKKISFLCNDATHIQLEDESVEIIIGCRFFGTLSPESRQDEVFKEMQRVLKKWGHIYLIENSHLGVFEKIRGKNLLPSNPTIAYNERLVHKYGFSINKEISSYFKFSNLAEAKQVFWYIRGEEVAKRVKSKKINHEILIFKWEK